MTTGIIIIPQRDLLGQINEYVVALEANGQRHPIEQCEWLTQARQTAKDAMFAHHARRITIAVEGAVGESASPDH